MSQFINLKRRCAICGEEHEFAVVLSTNSFGYSDLDMRPPEMERSCLGLEIQRCPNCHYANGDISKPIHGITIDSLKNEHYQAVVGKEDISETAKSFILAATLQAAAKIWLDAGMNFLRAAWIFDDRLENHHAVYARKNAVDCLLRYDNPEHNINIDVIIVDICRRIEKFDEAESYVKELLKSGVDETTEKILNYELLLIDSEDSACHSVGEIPGI